MVEPKTGGVSAPIKTPRFLLADVIRYLLDGAMLVWAYRHVHFSVEIILILMTAGVEMNSAWMKLTNQRLMRLANNQKRLLVILGRQYGVSDEMRKIFYEEEP